MENQTLPTPTSRLLARSNDVRTNGALTIAEAALPAADAVVDAIKRDLILRKIDTDAFSLPEIVFRILMNGDPVERLALARFDELVVHNGVGIAIQHDLQSALEFIGAIRRHAITCLEPKVIEP